MASNTGHICFNSTQQKAFKQMLAKELQMIEAGEKLQERLNPVGQDIMDRSKFARKVPDEEVKVLYNGVSKECEGRYAYLKTQRKKNPVKRYPYPKTSSHWVGWELQSELSDSNQNVFEKSEYGRKPIVQSTFYRSKGVFNPPDDNMS